MYISLTLRAWKLGLYAFGLPHTVPELDPKSPKTESLKGAEAGIGEGAGIGV